MRQGRKVASMPSSPSENPHSSFRRCRGPSCKPLTHLAPPCASGVASAGAAWSPRVTTGPGGRLSPTQAMLHFPLVIRKRAFIFRIVHFRLWANPLISDLALNHWVEVLPSERPFKAWT